MIYHLDSATKSLASDAVVFVPASDYVYINTRSVSQNKVTDEKTQFKNLFPTYFSYRNRDYCLVKLQKGTRFQLSRGYTMFGTYDLGTKVTQTIPQTVITATADDYDIEKEITLNTNISNLGVKTIMLRVMYSQLYSNIRYVRIRILVNPYKSLTIQTKNIKLTTDYTFPDGYLTPSSNTKTIDGISYRIYEIIHNVDVKSGGQLIGSFSGDLIFTPITFPIK